jgi:pimeloyl-ACP methyl ester carboxylesterase
MATKNVVKKKSPAKRGTSTTTTTLKSAPPKVSQRRKRVVSTEATLAATATDPTDVVDVMTNSEPVSAPAVETPNEAVADSTKRPLNRDEIYHLQLPFDAELSPAATRRYRETVVFVHHFGGSKKSLTRHVNAINQLGFDAVVFNLIFSDTKPKDRLPITADLKFGTRHIWTEQIEAVLNAIPGRKIIYSFSMPSASALAAISRRNAKDVAAWVCDGGPFLSLTRCVWNLYKHEYEVKSRLVRGAFTGLSLVLFGLGFEREVKEMLLRLPEGFPVLSIRGWDDPLVAPVAIDQVFEQQTHLEIEMLSFGEGRHLDGLKRFPEQYLARLEKFLARFCAPISAAQ